jgi:nucleoside-diphosphate-sugar epimerase
LRVLVTGGTGFIGSHLIPKLMKESHEVYSLARYVTGRYVLGENVKTVFADLRDYHAVSKAVKTVQPETVIHLAAISPVSYSYEHPQEVVETNFNGTVNLAEACLRYIPHFKQFIFASTAETYGNQEKFPIFESAPQRPNSPYAVSKLACEKYLLYLRDAYDFPITIMRCFNTYGRKRNRHFVAERIITQMLEGKNPIRLGDPDVIRDLMYVEDHVDAYLTVLGNEKAIGEVFNFCTEQGTSIKELASTIASILDWKGEIKWHSIPQRPLDIKCLVGSYEKARRVLGWKPKWSLKEGLEVCVEWWKRKLQ